MTQREQLNDNLPDSLYTHGRQITAKMRVLGMDRDVTSSISYCINPAIVDHSMQQLAIVSNMETRPECGH